MLHYNEQEESQHSKQGDESENGSKNAKKKKKTTCADYMKRFDQLILRPILIHKYEKDKESRAKDFYEMLAHEGNAMKKFY